MKTKLSNLVSAPPDSIWTARGFFLLILCTRWRPDCVSQSSCPAALSLCFRGWECLLNVMSMSQRALWCCAGVNLCYNHHLNKGTAGRRSPSPPLRFSQWWGWISSTSTFPLFCPLRDLILSSLEVRFQSAPSQTYIVRTQIVSDMSVCELACLHMTLYDLSLYCLRWQLKEVYDDQSSFSLIFESLLSKHSRLWSLALTWAQLN